MELLGVGLGVTVAFLWGSTDILATLAARQLSTFKITFVSHSAGLLALLAFGAITFWRWHLPFTMTAFALSALIGIFTGLCAGLTRQGLLEREVAASRLTRFLCSSSGRGILPVMGDALALTPPFELKHPFFIHAICTLPHVPIFKEFYVSDTITNDTCDTCHRGAASCATLDDAGTARSSGESFHG